MGDHHHRHPLGGELEHDVEHLLDHLRVERRGRLVEEHHLGVHGKGPGDGDALLLAPRALAGIGIGLLGDPDPDQLADRLFLGLGLATPSHLALRQRDVLEDGEMREEVELLEDHSDLGPHVVEVGLDLGEFVAVDRDETLGRHFQQVDAAQHRRLAGAAGAHDDDHLALGDFEVEVAHGVDGLVERLGEPPEGDHRGGAGTGVYGHLSALPSGPWSSGARAPRAGSTGRG